MSPSRAATCVVDLGGGRGSMDGFKWLEGCCGGVSVKWKSLNGIIIGPVSAAFQRIVEISWRLWHDCGGFAHDQPVLADHHFTIDTLLQAVIQRRVSRRVSSCPSLLSSRSTACMDAWHVLQYCICPFNSSHHVGCSSNPCDPRASATLA